MTHVAYINCEKWQKIIGITLWIGATIGLALGVCYGFEGTFNPLKVPPIPPIDNDTQTIQDFNNQLIAHGKAIDTNVNNVLLFALSTAGTILNSSVILYVVNAKYSWIEIRCGVKPNQTEVSS